MGASSDTGLSQHVSLTARSHTPNTLPTPEQGPSNQSSCISRIFKGYPADFEKLPGGFQESGSLLWEPQAGARTNIHWGGLKSGPPSWKTAILV